MLLVKEAFLISRAIFIHPSLWITAIKAAWRFIPNKWWKNGLLPPKEWIEFRSQAYGMSIYKAPPEEFLSYLRWCKDFPGPIR